MRVLSGHLSGMAIGLALLVTGAGAGLAEEHAACSGLAWPLETEVSLMTSSDTVALDNGAEIASPPEKAITVTLKPSAEVKMPVPAGVKKKALGSDTYSGWFTLTDLSAPGTYQVTLSREGWIDVAQNGALLQSTGFTGHRDCKAFRKSVRFSLAAGPATVQISGTPAEKVTVVVRKVD